jgi:hypothetical protein
MDTVLLQTRNIGELFYIAGPMHHEDVDDGYHARLVKQSEQDEKTRICRCCGP